MELFLITLLVNDYDDAIDYYCNTLGFALIEDTRVTTEKRWVVVSPSGENAVGARVLLAQASTFDQREAVGAQTGDRVGFFLHTADFSKTYERLKAKGVRFCEAPRREPYGMVAVFKDLYGNKWDLIERAG